MKGRGLLIIAILLAAGALAHSVWLQRKLDHVTEALALEKQALRAESTENSAARYSIDELSLRFTHPELFTSREGVPKSIALEEFRRRGLLKRGAAAVDLRRLLGEPLEITEKETDAEAPNRWWHYPMHCSSFAIEFNPDGEALSFSEAFESDRPDTQRIDVW